MLHAISLVLFSFSWTFEFPCHEDVWKFTQGHAKGSWRSFLHPNYGPSKRAPTDKIGRWVQVSKVDKNQSRVEIIGPDIHEFIFFKKNQSCQRTISKKFGIKKMKNLKRPYAFDDSQLSALIKKEGSGIIYLWSPRSLKSLEGISVIKAIAKKNNIPVTFISDPNVDKKLALNFMKKYKLGNSLSQLSSFDLKMRYFNSQWPSLAVYHNGKIGDTRFSVRNNSQFSKWIKDQISFL